MSTPASSFHNTEKFKRFLTGHMLPKIRGKSCVLVLGPMGAGKSTAIGVQLGAVYETQPGEKGYQLIHSGVETPETSEGFTSQTLNIGAYEDRVTRLIYLDTAGINENRGKEELLWTRNNLSLLFSIVKELKSIVVVMSYQTFSMRGLGFRQLAENLAKVTMGEEAFYNSMVFVITNGYEGPHRVSKKVLVSEATKFLREEETQRSATLEHFKSAYPVSMKSKAAATIAGVAGLSDEQDAPLFNIDKVPEEDKKRLSLNCATIMLLKAFLNSSNNIVLSYPDGPQNCASLRKELIQRITQTPPMEASALTKIRKSHIPDNALLFVEVLAEVASGYLTNLSKEAEILTNLTVVYNRNEKLFDAVTRDWESAKRELCGIKKTEVTGKLASIGHKEEELSRLESSTKVLVHHEEPILKGRDAGFLGLRWWVGKSQAEYTYEYNGQPFIDVEYKVEPQADGTVKHYFEIPEFKTNKEAGKFTRKFVSHNGHDLDLKVQVMVYEKDLPATKKRCDVLRKEIENKKAELEILHTDYTALEAVSSATQLKEEIMRETKALQEELRKIARVFTAGLQTGGLEIDSKTTEWQVVTGLESLLAVLDIENLIDLSPATKQTLSEFRQSYKTIKTEKERPYIRDLLPEVLEAHSEIAVEKPREIRALLDNSFLGRVKSVIPSPSPYLQSSASSYFKAHEFELGLSVAFGGYLLKTSDASASTGYFWMLAMTTGLFIALSALREPTNRTVSGATKIVLDSFRELTRGITVFSTEVQKTGLTAREAGADAVRHVADNVNVDIDIKTPPKTIFEANGINFKLG